MVAHISASFLVMAVYSVVLMRHFLFLHLPGDGHVGFHLLAAVDSAVINVCVLSLCLNTGFNFFWVYNWE